MAAPDITNLLGNLDEDEASEILGEIVGIDSIWGNEEPLASHLADRFTEWGFEDVRLIDGPPGRPSVTARLRGIGGGRSLMLNGHLDMYELAEDWTRDPWALAREDGRFFGGGIADMKAGVAAIAAAAKLLREANLSLKGDVVLALVSAHFEGDVGTRAVLAEGLLTDGAIITEPSDMKIVVAHRGAAYFDITTKGKQAHSTAADQGINAIVKMMALLEALQDLDLPYEPHPLLEGPPLMNIGTIRGGTKHNQVPDRCTVSVDFRILPSQTPEDVKRRVEDMIASLRRDDSDLVAEVEFNKHWLSGPRIPFQIEPEWGIPAVVEDAYHTATGRDATRVGLPYWTGLAVLRQAGVECVNIGPGGSPYNFADEYVMSEDYFDAIRTLVAAAVAFCNQSK